MWYTCVHTQARDGPADTLGVHSMPSTNTKNMQRERKKKGVTPAANTHAVFCSQQSTHRKNLSMYQMVHTTNSVSSTSPAPCSTRPASKEVPAEPPTHAKTPLPCPPNAPSPPTPAGAPSLRPPEPLVTADAAPPIDRCTASEINVRPNSRGSTSAPRAFGCRFWKGVGGVGGVGKGGYVKDELIRLVSGAEIV